MGIRRCVETFAAVVVALLLVSIPPTLVMIVLAVNYRKAAPLRADAELRRARVERHAGLAPFDTEAGPRELPAWSAAALVGPTPTGQGRTRTARTLTGGRAARRDRPAALSGAGGRLGRLRKRARRAGRERVSTRS